MAQNTSRPLDLILQKEMSRKEFLVTMGFGVASLLGMSTILHLLTGKSFDATKQFGSTSSQSRGYGSSAYGR